jgi:hypothetical protein
MGWVMGEIPRGLWASSPGLSWPLRWSLLRCLPRSPLRRTAPRSAGALRLRGRLCVNGRDREEVLRADVQYYYLSY